MRPSRQPRPLEESPGCPRGCQRAIGVAEAVLAELRDLDPRDCTEWTAGGGGRLPCLGRLRPAAETPEHPRPLGGDPLVRPAGPGIPPCGPGDRPETTAAAVRQ